MSKNSENQLTSDICHKQSCVRTILFAWTALVMLVAMANPTFADDTTATEFPSPLWVTDIESSDIGTSLTLSENAYEILTELHAVRLTDFPLSRDKSVDLDLEQFSITTPATRIVAGTEEGDIPIAPPDISLFRGRVADVNDSRVVLGISPRGCYGMIHLPQEGYVLTPLHQPERGPGGANHIVHNVSELPEPILDVTSACGVQTELTERPAPIKLAPVNEAVQFRFCRLALECDYEYWNQFNDMDHALHYIYVLFATVGEIYERDVSVKLALTFIRIWTNVSDPYSVTGGGCVGLHEFQAYWRANHSTPGQPGYVERDLAHMLSSRSVGSCGNIGQLCKEYGYSFAGGIHTAATDAASLPHDIYHAAHEIGHTFDGIHTHCFDPPLHKCHSGEPGCWSGGQDCNTTPGTIMSYCHFCGGYGPAQMLQEFHSANITRMRTLIDSSCLQLVRNPCYVDWRNTSETEDGTLAHPYNTVKEGVEAVLPGGTVSIANGNYPETNWLNLVTKITIWQPMTLTATGGTVNIGE